MKILLDKVHIILVLEINKIYAVSSLPYPKESMVPTTLTTDNLTAKWCSSLGLAYLTDCSGLGLDFRHGKSRK